MEASRNFERGKRSPGGVAGSRLVGRERGRRGRVLGLHLGRVGELRARRQVAHPEEREDERDHRAEACDVPRDDQADEQHDHADGEADGPETRARDVRVFVVRLQRG